MHARKHIGRNYRPVRIFVKVFARDWYDLNKPGGRGVWAASHPLGMLRNRPPIFPNLYRRYGNYLKMTDPSKESRIGVMINPSRI